MAKGYREAQPTEKIHVPPSGEVEWIAICGETEVWPIIAKTWFEARDIARRYLGRTDIEVKRK